MLRQHTRIADVILCADKLQWGVVGLLGYLLHANAL